MPRLDDHLFAVTPHTAQGHLDVGDGHRLYWEEAGDPDGIPLVLVHGGPGGRNGPEQRALLDPAVFRIVQFDQRGCGRSEAEEQLRANTLQHTIRDMEALRSELGIERWWVCGGSWGSTVALAYAEAHPEAVRGLLIACVWLARPSDVHWWYYGVRTIFPDTWSDYASLVAPEERSDLRQAYWRRIMSDDPEVALQAAEAQYRYEESFMRFETPLAPLNVANALDYSRVFSHYAVHDFFLEDDEIVQRAAALEGIPLHMVQGRYDMCTPLCGAYDLQQALPQSVLRVVPSAGHHPAERALSIAITQEVRGLVARLSPDLS